MNFTLREFENCAEKVMSYYPEFFNKKTTVKEFLDFLGDYKNLKWYYLHTLGEKQISNEDFYGERTGHDITHLQKILEASMFFNKKHRVWLSGDSSLDNKHWLLDKNKGELPPVYDAVLSSSEGIQDVAYFLNKLFEKNSDDEWITINTSIENTDNVKQDKFIRDNISDKDVLIVSLGINDILLNPSQETIDNIIKVLRSDIKKINSGKAPGLKHITSIFKDRLEDYIKRLVSKNKPRLVLINTVYYPYHCTGEDWSLSVLSECSLSINPNILQSIISHIHKKATSKIKIPGIKVFHVPLFKVLTASNKNDYDNTGRYPSIQGGKKIAQKYYNIIKKDTSSTKEVSSSMKSHFPKLQPTEHLQGKIFLTTLTQLGISKKDRESYKQTLHSQPFIFGHVSGRGDGSPQRGVLVMGDSTFEESPKVIHKTYWTLSQNHSNISLESATTPYPNSVSKIVPEITKYMKESFPDAPISPATYALAVGNWYEVGGDHTISGHTDDQPWYASPPVFASITTFPKGVPDDWRETYRFQVFDPGHSKYIDLYLADESVCMMRADIMHRVLPPLKSVYTHKPRVNITFRNLVSPYTDPLGYTLAMANHYRYYGVPLRVLIPKDVKEPEILIERYRKINNNLKVNKLNLTREQRNKKKKELRAETVKLYKNIGEKLDKNMISKSNVVLESLEMSL